MIFGKNMSDHDGEDPLTKLNTQLNKSMVLMDNTMEVETYQQKSNRSITINPEAQPSGSPSNTGHNTARRSILKKSEKASHEKTSTSTDATNTIDTEAQNNELQTERMNSTDSARLSENSLSTSRPHNLQDMIQEETLIVDSTCPSFSLDDISDSEDIWIMDIPRTVDPQELKGQTLILGEKSKFKIKEERYCAVNHDVRYNVTCVLNTGKVKSRYKTVNVKPAGAITVRRKLLGIPKIKPIQVESSGVPFPKNLKTRHPLFGVNQEGKVKKGAVDDAD